MGTAQIEKEACFGGGGRESKDATKKENALRSDKDVALVT